MAGRFSIEGIFKLKTGRFDTALGGMKRRLDSFTRSSGGHMRLLSRIGSAMRTGLVAALAAVVAMSVAAARALQSVVETGMEFDQSLARAGALFGNLRRGTEEFERLEEAARRVGVETEFSSSQAADGLGFLAMAGFSAEQAVASLAGVVDLATASQMELAEATDVASDILGNQGLMTDDADQLQRNLQRVNDVLAATASSTNTDVRELFEAFRTGGSVAHGAGQEIETTSALLGTLAEAGVKGAEAGTSLRTMFTRMVNPSRQAQRALRRLGVSLEDEQGNVRDMVDVIGDLEQGLEGRGTAERGRLLAQIFGARGVNAANILIEEGADGLREYRASLEAADGAAAEMAETMRDTASGDLASMNSALEGLRLGVWDVVRGPVRSVIQAITEWARANQDLISSGLQDFVRFLQENMATIRVIAIAIAVVFGVIGAALLVLVTVMASFVGVIGGLVVGAIALAVAAVDWLVEAWDGLVEATQSAFRAVWEPIQAFAVAVGEVLVGVWVLIQRALNPVTNAIRGAFQSAAAWVVERWRPVGAFFGRVWRSVSSAAGSAWQRLTSGASSVATRLRAVFGPIVGFFSSIWTAIRDAFVETFGDILEGIRDAVNLARTVGGNTLALEREGGDKDEPGPQLVTPSERVAREVSESVSRTQAEVTVRAEPGTSAEVTRRPTGGGLDLAASGGT